MKLAVIEWVCSRTTHRLISTSYMPKLSRKSKMRRKMKLRDEWSEQEQAPDSLPV